MIGKIKINLYCYFHIQLGETYNLTNRQKQGNSNSDGK